LAALLLAMGAPARAAVTVTTQPVSQTVSPNCPRTIWPNTAVPAIADVGPDSAVELGVTFEADSDGYITGIRFYKNTGNTGTHVGNLWSSTGTLLATATFTESASGWQQVNFSNPVAVTANTAYVASYHSTVGHYSVDPYYFASTGFDNAPLHALANGSGVANGPYAYGDSSTFPTNTYNTANYWVDVVFNNSGTVSPIVLAPSITTPPVSQTVTSGQTATFSVTASGTAPLSYQWNQGGTAISGATSPSYTTPATTTSDNGAQFTVVVSNAAGSITSNAATLTVNTPPSITTQPASQTVTASQTAAFSVVATGTAPLSYQWQKDGTAISGATSPSYTTPATTASDNGAQFTAVVSNAAGSATSNAAIVNVNTPPSITSQPVGQTVIAGQTVTFSVVVTGTAPLSYQWIKNGVNIGGATSSSYTTTATTTSDDGTEFTVVVSNLGGSTTSNAVTVNVSIPPTITTPPVSQTVTAGHMATFAVVATGSAPLSYQWQKNGTAISGATSSPYTTPATATSDDGAQFTVVVSNAAGNITSNAATLTVNTPPSITSQPASQTVTASQTATFSVVATGTAPLSYRWRKSGTTISGATSSTYTTPATTASDNGARFTVVVSNAAGSATSNAAKLTVNTPPSISTPASQTITSGQTATFSATASGTAPLSYQWNQGGTAIRGATSPSYTTPSTTTSDNGAQFTVVVSNSVGSITSNAATLTVNAGPLQLTSSASSLRFPSVIVGGTSTLSAALTAFGDPNVTISSISISGPGFNVSGLSTGQTLTPGQTATLNVTFAPAATGNVAGGVTVTSDATNSPTSIALSSSAVDLPGEPVCGQLNDGLVHLPLDWATFIPPATGQSYVDPVFGCTVKRITNGSLEEPLWDGSHPSLMNYYSTFTPLNATDTLLLLVSNDGAWRIRDVNGNIVVPVANMPGMNNGHPVWDASNGNAFYYTLGNVLYQGTVSGNTVNPTALHTFSEYGGGIVSPDSADLSQDGDHIALVGQNANSTMDIFVWSLSLQAKTSVYTTACTVSGSVVSTPQPGCLHKLQLTADNLLSIQFVQDGTGTEQGVRLWNGSTLTHMQDSTNHYDTGYDLAGNSVFVSMANSYTLAGLASPCPSGWGVDVRRLNLMSSAICLLDNQPYWHVSYRGSASQPWIAFSFFESRTSSPELFTNDPNYQAPTAANWLLYEDEIILEKVDGTAVYRLAHARSRSLESYWAQPHAAISRSGHYVVFTSDMAWPNGCPAGMHVANDCEDVYLIKIQ